MLKLINSCLILIIVISFCLLGLLIDGDIIWHYENDWWIIIIVSFVIFSGWILAWLRLDWLNKNE